MELIPGYAHRGGVATSSVGIPIGMTFPWTNLEFLIRHDLLA